MCQNVPKVILCKRCIFRGRRRNPHTTICTFTPHFALSTLDLHSTLCTPHFTLHTIHITLYTSHSSQHFTLHTLYFTFYTQHFTMFTLHILHSTRFHTPESAPVRSRGKKIHEDIAPLSNLFDNSVLRDCIRVRWLVLF